MPADRARCCPHELRRAGRQLFTEFRLRRSRPPLASGCAPFEGISDPEKTSAVFADLPIPQLSARPQRVPAHAPERRCIAPRFVSSISAGAAIARGRPSQYLGAWFFRRTCAFSAHGLHLLPREPCFTHCLSGCPGHQRGKRSTVKSRISTAVSLAILLFARRELLLRYSLGPRVIEIDPENVRLPPVQESAG